VVRAPCPKVNARMEMQEAFDAAVQENIDEFGMEVS
jgi:hypothetical protein